MLLGLCVSIGLVVTVSSAYLLQQGQAGSAGLHADRWLQLVSSLGFFLLPSLLGTFILGRSLPEGLQLRRPVAGAYSQAFLVGVVMIPASGFLLLLNGLIPLPAWASALEAAAAEKTLELLGTKSAGTMLLNLLVVALVPAIAEECFFRGVFQQALVRLCRSVGVGVWLGAAFFSLIHLQFGGFIPRLWMGAILGYVVYWSRSLWPAVLIHLLNNAVGVVSYYVLTLTHHVELVEVEKDWPNWLGAGFCFLLTSWLLLRWKRHHDSTGSHKAVPATSQFKHEQSGDKPWNDICKQHY